jgi:cytochrome c biogenesis protein CcdA
MDFFTGLLVDLSLFGGIILFIMSFFKKYRDNRYKMMIIGIILVIVGLVFLDYASLQEAYLEGYEAAQGL